MSRMQQDQFVDDDEEECCPLCVEEFDLSDRNFRPCPCGYQICQFCYNNIKTTMNGLCPACRRPYDDSTIEWKTISPEEMAQHKQLIAQKAKKNAQIRQKEAQKAEADSLSRKHLSGLRVVQKNLVYVTGLTPTIREDELLKTLRGDDYFGQYGKILKIVVSKAKENAQHQQSVGVYVTFARKEDAEKCINAVDGSQNGDRTLRAQFGTTKYCSAYLRGETCNNRNCMFLHEPGEDNDSFTRQDLSMMNSIQTQQPSQSSTSRAAPPAHQGPAVAAATPMNRQDSTDTSSSIQDAPGLPATASWGSKAILERRASRSTIASNNASPMVTNAVPVQASKAPKPAEAPKKKGKDKEKEKEKDKSPRPSKSATPQPQPTPTPAPAPAARPAKSHDDGVKEYLKLITSPSFRFIFSSAALSEEELKAVKDFPLLLDPNGGAKRRAIKEKEKELTAQREAEVEVKVAPQQAPGAEREDNEATAGGSLQLGGEPEDGPETSTNHLNQHAIAPPGQQGFGGSLFGQNTPLAEDFSSLGLSNRGLTPQQQQQLLLSNFKSGTQATGLLSNMQNAQPQQHNLAGNGSNHTRHTSRFSFANDSASASANVQPVGNQKLMNQQNSMMPKNANQFNPMSQHQPLGGQFFPNVQGPPPGLKPTGTPPVSGTGMFGQGHGFATGGLPYGAGATARNNNDAMYQDLLRSRNMDGGARLGDAGKHDTSLSVEEQASINVDALVNDCDNEPLRVTPIIPISSQLFDQGRRSTPTIPPGFTIPAIPKTVMEGPYPRSGSLPMSRTNSFNITPAIPVVPVTPIQASTPNTASNVKPKSDAVEPATPKATSTPTSAIKPQPTTPSKTVTKETVVVPQTPKEPTPREASRKAKGETEQTPKSTPETRRSISEIAAKDASKAKENSKKIQPLTQTTPKKDTQKEPARTPAANATPTSTKRQPPGKLDIPSATKASIEEESAASTFTKAESQTKNTRSLPATASVSVPPSPAAATGSPIKRTAAPRTLRVIATPKTEVPSPLSTASAPSLPQIPTVDKLRSRQASIASINQPGTPASDLISDTASIASTSMSRASSPPPVGKIGSAPVRKKTKSQAKKDRQERKKQKEEEQLEDNKSDVEVMQAPIIGRKKKAKKPTANPKPIAAAFKSQPASPKPATVEEEHVETPAAVPRTVSTVKVSTPEPEPEAEPEQSKERREYNAQAIIADLQRTGELLASTLEFFKPLSSSLTHVSRAAQSGNMATPPDLKLHFSEADLDALAKKKPVRLNGHDGRPDSRTLITPKGKFFYGLSEELEAKALDLEKHIEALKGHARFHPRRQTAHGHSMAAQSHSNDVLPAIATALQEAGKKLNTNGGQQMPKLDGSSAMLGSTNVPLPPVQAQDVPIPQVPPPQQQQTPADAGAYLNQYVLPRTDNPPPNQPRPEMAAVGGPPGAGTANMSVNANRFAKAAKAVVEGGAVGSTEIDGVGVMAADRLGGVFVQGLEALVGAGLGYDPTQDFSRSTSLKSGAKKPSLEEYVNNMDMKTLINAMEVATGMEGVVSSQWRGSLLSVGEAEQAVHAARKEHDVLEKKLMALVKKNRKLALGGGK